YKAKLAHLFMKEVTSKGSNQHDLSLEIENTFDQMTSLENHIDHNALSFLILREMKNIDKDNNRLQKYIDRFAQNHPQRYEGYYFRAAFHWKNKDREKTLYWLKEAEKRDPQNQNVQYTLKSVHSAYDKKIFRFSFGFDLSEMFSL
ncbi:MAG: hypothetical protein OXB84_08845, partial [Halobacteriovoraceae bacterium]|nr:hypothetical protein [Halobacteriovoraceae bacterium]